MLNSVVAAKTLVPDSDQPDLTRYRPWLQAAALYNFLWGASVVLMPAAFFDLVGMSVPGVLPLWQVVGMLVLVFAPGYWWASCHPRAHRHIIAIGLLGKVLGPIGFVWAVAAGQLPIEFGWTILTNDLIWWPSFGLFVRDAARLAGGWGTFLRGE